MELFLIINNNWNKKKYESRKNLKKNLIKLHEKEWVPMKKISKWVGSLYNKPKPLISLNHR